MSWDQFKYAWMVWKMQRARPASRAHEEMSTLARDCMATIHTTRQKLSEMTDEGIDIDEHVLREIINNELRKLRLNSWNSWKSRSLPPLQLPSAAQFALILLSRQRRDDVLNDLCDWAEHDGRFNAKCWLRLMVAFFGQVLDVLYRIGEVVGKFHGAK